MRWWKKGSRVGDKRKPVDEADVRVVRNGGICDRAFVCTAQFQGKRIGKFWGHRRWFEINNRELRIDNNNNNNNKIDCGKGKKRKSLYLLSYVSVFSCEITSIRKHFFILYINIITS